MPDADSLIHLTLDLFLYDLVEPTASAVTPQAGFLQRFSAEQPTQSILQDRLAKAEIVHHQKNSVPPIDKQHVVPLVETINGFYYLARLNDTYALIADSAGQRPANPGQTDPAQKQPIATLRSIQQDLLRRIKTDHAIGSTWFVWGKLAHPQQDPIATVTACTEALKLPPPAPAVQPDQLFGASLFDLWQPDDSRPHCLIYLLPYDAAPTPNYNQIYSQLFPQLIYLLWYRHKITWAYQNTRKLKADLKQAAIVTQKQAASLPSLVNPQPNLANLQTSLATNLNLFSTYGSFLSELEEQQQTLQVNQQNYVIRLRSLTNADPNSQLTQLQRFGHYANDKYLAQIQADMTSFSPQLRLLENITQTIQGILTLEQTRSERLLNQTVASVGVGLAVSQVASAVILAQPPAGIDANLYRWQTAGWSMAWGIGASLGIWLVLRLFR